MEAELIEPIKDIEELEELEPEPMLEAIDTAGTEVNRAGVARVLASF
jgi:hypothetical protein